MPAAQDLTARIRALYEDTSVPVREIAAIAGVTERTLYRYVEKQNWKRRYVCLPRDAAVRRANRGRRWQHAEGFRPAKGSGGRFIRREDIGKPFPTGLKALDARGRADAQARCDAADPLAREAQQEVMRAHRADERVRAWRAVERALQNLEQFRDDHRAWRKAKRLAKEWGGDPGRAPKVPPCPGDETTERALRLALDAATDYLEAAQRAAPACAAGRGP
ncbi:hypothetical protein MXD81_52405 [Microbacteriaceae bacterium K1510]|nr:hypothetical protein [Microbacteriaceae bacterium K1510]